MYQWFIRSLAGSSTALKCGLALFASRSSRTTLTRSRPMPRNCLITAERCGSTSPDSVQAFQRIERSFDLLGTRSPIGAARGISAEAEVDQHPAEGDVIGLSVQRERLFARREFRFGISCRHEHIRTHASAALRAAPLARICRSARDDSDVGQAPALAHSPRPPTVLPEGE